MVPNCYFCHKGLTKFIDKENSGNYERHYVCYNCPQYQDKPGIPSIWGPPFCVILGTENDQIAVTYFYLPSVELHVSIFHFEKPFVDFRKRSLEHVMRLNNVDLDIFQFTPDELEGKIKTWLTFS